MKSKGWICGLLVLLLVAGAWLTRQFNDQRTNRDISLPSGNLLRLQRISYGTNHVFYLDHSLVAYLTEMFPRSQTWFSSSSMDKVSTGSAEPSRLLFITETVPGSSNFLGTTSKHLVLYDAHG